MICLLPSRNSYLVVETDIYKSQYKVHSDISKCQHDTGELGGNMNHNSCGVMGGEGGS